jgi:hypothetical protein
VNAMNTLLGMLLEIIICFDNDNRYPDTKSLDKQERNNENHLQNNESIG